MPKPKPNKPRARAMTSDAILDVLSRADVDDKIRVRISLDKPPSTYTVKSFHDVARLGFQRTSLGIVGRNGAEFTVLRDGKSWAIGSSRSGAWRGRTVLAVELFPARQRGTVEPKRGASEVDREHDLAPIDYDFAPETSEAAAPESEWSPLSDPTIAMPDGYTLEFETLAGVPSGRARLCRPWGVAALDPFDGVAQAATWAWQSWSKQHSGVALEHASKMARVLEQIRVSCAPHVKPGAHAELRLALAEHALHYQRTAPVGEAATRRAMDLAGGLLRDYQRRAMDSLPGYQQPAVAWAEPIGGLTRPEPDGAAAAMPDAFETASTLASSPAARGYSPTRAGEGNAK